MSSEEPFNYIENKIREAAENHEIVFEESSWKKMELLLDKEPRRKPFVWWWFLLPVAIVSGVGLYVWANKPEEKIVVLNVPAKNTNVINKFTTAALQTSAGEESQKNNEKLSVSNNTAVVTSFHPKNEMRQSSHKKNKYYSSTTSKLPIKPNVEGVDENITANEIAVDDKARIDFSINNPNATTDETAINNVSAKTVDSLKKEITTLTNTDSNSVETTKKPILEKIRLLHQFYIVGSPGFDISSTSLFAFKNNKATLRYGAALGFNLSKKLSVQAGFYAGKKKYLAKSGDYNFKAGSYYNTVKIIKVDAECIVYEIPVSVRYYFIERKKLNVYSGAGVSSYLMKNEDYVVHFLRNNMPYAREWYYTGNQNLFSTFILLVGAEKKLTKKLNIQIEPSVSIPLKGVGEGSVKLFSTGLQLGVKYFPFK